MRSIFVCAAFAAANLSALNAPAQTLNFTNNLNFATGPQADRGLLKDQPETAHFPAGSAIYAVLYVTPAGFRDINAFSGAPEGGGALRVTVEMATKGGGWDLVSSRLVDVSADLGTRRSIVLPIIPDKPDDSSQFNQLLDMISAHKGPAPILMRVKIANGVDGASYAQNGFFLDVASGLGRYGDWLAQRTANQKDATADFERKHLKPRTDFVRAYHSLPSNPKFISDVGKWWVEKAGGSRLLSTKICSDGYVIFRDSLGVISERQLCALITYKSGSQCFATIRRFSYRRIGQDQFDTSVVDATYENQSIPADPGATFSGGQPYQIECGPSK